MNQKGFSNIILIIIGIVIGVAAIGLYSAMKPAATQTGSYIPVTAPITTPTTQPTITPIPTVTSTTTTVTTTHPTPTIVCGIHITSPAVNDVVAATVNIAGSVDGSCHWVGFEGQVGTVRVFDSSGNPLSSTSVLTATTDWMTLPVSFTSRVTINTPPQHVATGYLLFTNEDPSGNFPETYVLPVRF